MDLWLYKETLLPIGLNHRTGLKLSILVVSLLGKCHCFLNPGDCLCQSTRLAIGRWWSPYHLSTLARNGELSIYWRYWTLRWMGLLYVTKALRAALGQNFKENSRKSQRFCSFWLLFFFEAPQMRPPSRKRPTKKQSPDDPWYIGSESDCFKSMVSLQELLN